MTVNLSLVEKNENIIALSSFISTESVEDSEYPSIVRLEYDRDITTLSRKCLELLPISLSEAIEEAQSVTDTSREMCLMSALHCLNFAAMGHANVFTGHNSSPISLFLLNVCDSGERKSRVDAVFTKPIHQFQEILQNEESKNLENYQNEFALWNKKVKQLEKINIKFDQSSGEDYLQKLSELTAVCPVQPADTMLFVSDFNIPSLKQLLKSNGKPILSIKTNEGASLFLTDFFKKNGTELMAILNGLFDNEGIYLTRVGTGKVTIKDKRFNFFIQIQPNVWEKMMKNNELIKALGFTARILACRPRERKGTRLISESQPFSCETPAIDMFNKRIFSLLQKELPLKKIRIGDKMKITNELEPPEISFTPEAYKLWLSFYNSIEIELKIGGKYRSIHEFASKIGNICARIAANFHIFEGKNEGENISEKCMEGAIELSKFFLQEHFIVMGIKNVDDQAAAAIILFEDLKKITDGNIFSFDNNLTKRLTKNKNINLRIKKTYSPALDLLLQNNYIIKSREGKYLLNPRHEQREMI